MDREAFDEMVARCDPAMVVVTAAARGERSGCLVGFHSQCSIEPPRYALWLSKANHTYGVALDASHLGVHFLSTGDAALAELFGTLSGDDVDKFARCDHEEGIAGVPLLTGCADRMVLRRLAVLDDDGDHACFVAEPVDVMSVDVARVDVVPAAVVPAEVLRYAEVAQLSPGHDADE